MKNNKLLKMGLIGLSCLTINSWASNIKHVQDVSKYPISSDLISVSRGGTLPDKKAITDGIGTVLVGSLNLSDKSYSNKTFNKLLYDNKKDIIDNDKSLDTLITDGIITLDTKTDDEINKDNILVDINNSSGNFDGKSCNTHNTLIGQTYLNGICQGGTKQINFNNIYIKLINNYSPSQNYGTITELILKDINNNNINYTITNPTYDTKNGLHIDPNGDNNYSFFNFNNLWSKDNLSDGDFNYINNNSGSKSSAIIIIPNNLSTIFKVIANNINSLDLYVGGPEHRTPKIIEIYDNNMNKIDQMNIGNWTKVTKVHFDLKKIF